MEDTVRQACAARRLFYLLEPTSCFGSMSSSVGGGRLGDRRFASGEVPLGRAGGCSCKQLGTAPLLYRPRPHRRRPVQPGTSNTTPSEKLISFADNAGGSSLKISHPHRGKISGMLLPKSLCPGVLTRLLPGTLHGTMERSRL